MATFDERAREWDSPEHVATATAVSAAIRSAVPLAPTMRVLEIGAGTGLLGLALVADLGALVLSDPSAGMREVAEEKVRHLGLGNVEVVDLDLTKPDLASRGEAFDLVISQLMVHHVRDTDAMLSAVFGLLAPGGRIAMADLDAEDGTFHDPEAEGIHHQGFDRIAIGVLAKAAGFIDIGVRDAAVIERHGRGYSLFLLTARRPPEDGQAVG
jgi:ubiquinone/menaquinone biosynthesis C-methylase UbiE